MSSNLSKYYHLKSLARQTSDPRLSDSLHQKAQEVLNLDYSALKNQVSITNKFISHVDNGTLWLTGRSCWKIKCSKKAFRNKIESIFRFGSIDIDFSGIVVEGFPESQLSEEDFMHSRKRISQMNQELQSCQIKLKKIGSMWIATVSWKFKNY